jgi:hypothetical protein
MLRHAIAALALSLGVIAGTAHAQQPQVIGQAPTGTVAPLPPALQAAVLSGNPAIITQAINVLSGGDAARLLALANQVVQTAERLLATNPQAAVAAAGAAVGVTKSNAVQTASPQQTMNVIDIASRIFVAPTAQQASPQIAAAGALDVGQVSASPAVYSSNPAAAVQVMANAYAVVQSPTIRSAVPAASAALTQTLNTAAVNGQLNSFNPANSAQIAQILGGQVTARTVQVAQQQTGQSQQRTDQPIPRPEPPRSGSAS